MTAAIAVDRRPDGTFAVEVLDGAVRTTHVVSVPRGFAGSLGAPDLEGERLVRVSFEFLLEREPATSILRSFDLEVIERYFPEYRRVMARRLAQGPPS